MNETLIWCALIGAAAYVIRGAVPSYYQLTSNRPKARLDAVIDDLDDLEQKVTGLLDQIKDLDETVTHNCLRLAVLEDAALKARTGTPANEARHD